MELTYKERQRAMTEFRMEPSQDVYTVMRDGKPYATITRSNQIVQWRD
jgi:hypothetical protein